jgi:hypothetical protein
MFKFYSRRAVKFQIETRKREKLANLTKINEISTLSKYNLSNLNPKRSENETKS